MPYDPGKHHRRSMRLRGYDYAQAGMYFVTACTYQRASLFGRIEQGAWHASTYGEIVSACLRDVPERFAHVTLDAWVVMPNHIHVIIVLDGANVAFTVGQIVAYFKYQSTKRINAQRATPAVPVWQRDYYDHIVRNDREYDRISRYIVENPLRWELDQLYPVH